MTGTTSQQHPVHPPTVPTHQISGYGELALPLTHYEAATVCGALAYVLGENDMPPTGDTGILRDVSARLRTLVQTGGRR